MTGRQTGITTGRFNHSVFTVVAKKLKNPLKHDYIGGQFEWFPSYDSKNKHIQVGCKQYC